MVLHTPKWGKHQWNLSSSVTSGLSHSSGSSVWAVCRPGLLWLYWGPSVSKGWSGTFHCLPLGLKVVIYPHLSPQAGCLLQQPRTLHMTGHWDTQLLSVTSCVWCHCDSLWFVHSCAARTNNDVFAVLPAGPPLVVSVVVLVRNTPEPLVLFALTFQDKSSLFRLPPGVTKLCFLSSCWALWVFAWLGSLPQLCAAPGVR